MKLTEDEWELIETSLRGMLVRIGNDQELEQLINTKNYIPMKNGNLKKNI